MNYELLLDEIMINAISAKDLIDTPQNPTSYGVCPLQLEYHTSIFLAGMLLAFGQERAINFLIQVEELEEDIMIYTWTIGPHFGKNYQLWDQTSPLPFPKTNHNPYPYLDKLFAYTAVLNNRTDHQIIFVKKGIKIWTLSEILKEQIKQGYALLVMSNLYQNLPTQEAKQLSETLIQKCKAQILDEKLQADFPAFACLEKLYDEQHPPLLLDYLINTGDLGMDEQKSTSMRYMIR